MLYFSRWTIYIVLGICCLGFWAAVPNFFSSETVEEWPILLSRTQINLGLDLQGGSSLLLEVDTDKLIEDRVQNLADSVRVVLRRADIGYRSLDISESEISVLLTDPETDLEAALDLIEQEFVLPQQPTAFASVIEEIDLQRQDEGFELSLNEAGLSRRVSQAMEESIEIIRRRIDESGINEPLIARQGGRRILVQLPGVEDPQRIKDLIGQTAKMTFHLLHPEAAAYIPGSRIPPGARLLYGQEPDPYSGQGESYLLRRRVEVDGASLINAQPATDPQSGQWVVNFEFDAIGTRRFAQVTRENVNRQFAIVLDDAVISAPVIREPILGGRGQISGQFSVASANDLAVLLRAGALPTSLTLVEERTVGPNLGADAIQAGLNACIIGFLLVILYMGVIYGWFGILANITLIANMIMIIGFLSLPPATLTLPGIAGLLLTLGMAVDANILINERIREEAYRGKSPYAAMEAGFRRAFSTILDSNVTTLLTMLLLYYFGSGPVRGFAVTISCGIVTTVFSAMFVSRLMMVSWLRRTRANRLPL